MGGGGGVVGGGVWGGGGGGGGLGVFVDRQKGEVFWGARGDQKTVRRGKIAAKEGCFSGLTLWPDNRINDCLSCFSNDWHRGTGGGNVSKTKGKIRLKREPRFKTERIVRRQRSD